jgi:general secretion pathway protein E
MQKKVNINPKSFEVESFNYDEGIKYSILPGIVDNKKYYIINEKNLIDALNYYSKLDEQLDVLITDEESFNRLLSQVLEIKTQKDLENKDLEEVEEENINLEDFVKNSIDILNSENAAPIIKFVNSMFFQAIKKNASDIHIETHENFGLLRFRIDGVLTVSYTHLTLPTIA